MTLGAMIMLVPVRATAHLRLLRSEPAAGASLVGVLPAIRLFFSLKAEVALSAILLVSLSGDTVALTPVESDPTGNTLVAFPRELMPAGRYVVHWRAASADGHPIHGQFEFGMDAVVPATAAAVEHDEHAGHDMPLVTTAPVRGVTKRAAEEKDVLRGPLVPALLLPVLATVARALSFAALFGIVGAVSFRFAVVPRLWRWQNGKRAAGALWRARRVALSACGIFLVSHVARLVLEGTMLLGGDTGRIAPAQLADAMAGSPWGIAWIVGLGGIVLALAGLTGTGGRPLLGWHAAALGSVMLVVSVSLSGHAAATSNPRVTVTLAILHGLFAAGWLGTLLLVVAAGIPAAIYDGRGDAPHQGVAELMAAFTPVAVVCGMLAAATGSSMAYSHLGSWTDLVRTGYGNALLAKLVVFAVTGALGLFHWRVAVPRVSQGGGTGSMIRTARGELLLGALILGVTAVLVATPLPGE